MYKSVCINKLNLENKLNSFKKPFIDFNKEIVIYGAGDMCKMALGFFDVYNIKINTIIDKKIKKINSKTVFNLDKLKNLNKESNICICISPVNGADVSQTTFFVVNCTIKTLTIP